MPPYVSNNYKTRQGRLFVRGRCHFRDWNWELRILDRKVGNGDLGGETSNIFYVHPYLDVSENSGTPKSSILIGFSTMNHPFWGTPIFGNTHLVKTNPFWTHIFFQMGWFKHQPVTNSWGKRDRQCSMIKCSSSIESMYGNKLKPKCRWIYHTWMVWECSLFS